MCSRVDVIVFLLDVLYGKILDEEMVVSAAHRAVSLMGVHGRFSSSIVWRKLCGAKKREDRTRLLALPKRKPEDAIGMLFAGENENAVRVAPLLLAVS